MSWAVRMDHAMVNAYKSMSWMVRMVNAASNRCGTALAWVLKACKAKTMLNSTKEKKRDLQFSSLSRWK